MSETIFFDLDGTILDTEKHYRKCWVEAANSLGYPMTDEQALSLRSLGRPFAVDRINGFFNDSEAYGKIRTKRMELMNKTLKEKGIELKPYAAETLTELQKRGHSLVIVTATDLERTQTYLRSLGLLDFFDKIVCATMVEKGKPAPDVYLYAASEVKKNPSQLYAVEDSPNGVMSAFNAGCKTIMIPDQTQPDEELKSHLYKQFDSLRDLLTIF
ncbi:MAG: HAD family phosphatase [Butyrivibrio sp.]|nr:HAD family phosphatase [Butyrivibrio sp.]